MLNTHQRFCITLGLQVPRFPCGMEELLKFRNYNKMIPAGFKCSADFEARLCEIEVPHKIPVTREVNPTIMNMYLGSPCHLEKQCTYKYTKWSVLLTSF